MYIYIYIYTYIYIYIHKHIHRHRHKHPAGPETVLVKIEFYQNVCVCVLPLRGNNCGHSKSVKFGRPNLGVFWAKCVCATVKREILAFSIGQLQASFSLHLSQHLCSFDKQRLEVTNDAMNSHMR